MSEGYDVIVVGAGPAGSTAARLCAKAGLNTLMVEEHAGIGFPMQCAGLLSALAFAECRVSDRAVINRVRGAKLVSGTGSNLEFRAPDTKALVVDRTAVDVEMAQNAGDAGAEIRPKTAAYDIRDGKLLTRGMHGHEEIAYRMLIAADGPKSMIARLHGMERPPTILAGIQADISCNIDPEIVELHPGAAPDFFGYAIPLNERRARIGLCTGTDARERFSKFVKPFGSSCVNLVTGTLPLGIMPKTYGKKTLYVGDTAGFAKPTSGGGVYTGIRSAIHAAAVAAECCEKNMFDDTALADYETRWQADIGRELAIGYRFFEFRQHLTPDDFGKLCQAMNTPSIIEAIIQYGDMDRPALLAKELVKKPALYSCLGILARAGISSIFT